MRRLLVAIGLLCAVASAAGVTQVQNASASANSVAFSSATTAGNLIVVFYAWSGSATAPTCADGGDTFVRVNSTIPVNDGLYAAEYYAADIVGGAANTITCTTETSAELVIAEYTGAALTSPVESYAVSSNLDSGATGTMTFPSVSASSGDAIVAVLEIYASPTLAYSSPFTTIVQLNGAHPTIAGDYQNATAGSYAAVVTGGSSTYTVFSVGVVAAFKPSGSPVVTMVPRHH